MYKLLLKHFIYTVNNIFITGKLYYMLNSFITNAQNEIKSING